MHLYIISHMRLSLSLLCSLIIDKYDKEICQFEQTITKLLNAWEIKNRIINR